jgi:hypothetical protein
MIEAAERTQDHGPVNILHGLGRKEDMWAIWIGLSIVLASGILFAIGGKPAVAGGTTP